MYGKQFIAGLMFLAVAHVRAQEEEEEEIEDETEGAELYEVSPEPDLEAFEEEDASGVEIPDGDWDLNYLAFILVPVDES